jgi:hypothetical protein
MLDCKEIVKMLDHKNVDCNEMCFCQYLWVTCEISLGQALLNMSCKIVSRPAGIL